MQEINELNEDGLAPIHYAARCNQSQIIQMLLDNGAGKLMTVGRGLRLIVHRKWLSYDTYFFDNLIVIHNLQYGQRPQ